MYAAGSLTLTQLIYSNDASANISIQKDLQQIRELDLEALRLDIARDAVAAYMNVMRTDALVRIRQQQVDLTRTNRELADLRRSVGAAGAAEVYRWEAELATARAGLLDAISANSLSERQLSRLLDEPLTTRWNPKQPEIDPPPSRSSAAREDAALLDTPDGYDRLTSTPCDAGPRREPPSSPPSTPPSRPRSGHSRPPNAPTTPPPSPPRPMSARSSPRTPPAGSISATSAISSPSSTTPPGRSVSRPCCPWSPAGRTRLAGSRRRKNSSPCRTDHRNAEEKLSQRTLSALDTATASWSTISLRQQAADAAGKTLELVRDAYARGAASIIALLDAQNNALTSELAAETAVYDFLDDWAEVQRSVAGLDVAHP